MDASRRPSWSSTALSPLSAQLLNFFSFQTNGPHLKPIPAGVLRAAFITCVPWLLYSHFHLYFCSVPQKRLQDMEKHKGLYCASSQAKKCSQKCLDKENNLPSFFFPSLKPDSCCSVCWAFWVFPLSSHRCLWAVLPWQQQGLHKALLDPEEPEIFLGCCMRD